METSEEVARLPGAGGGGLLSNCKLPSVTENVPSVLLYKYVLAQSTLRPAAVCARAGVAANRIDLPGHGIDGERVNLGREVQAAECEELGSVERRCESADRSRVRTDVEKLSGRERAVRVDEQLLNDRCLACAQRPAGLLRGFENVDPFLRGMRIQRERCGRGRSRRRRNSQDLAAG